MTNEALAAGPSDFELRFRLTTLQSMRSIPGQTSQQIAHLDAQIEGLQRTIDDACAHKPTAFDDLFAQVQAHEAMLLGFGCTVDALCQAFACVLGEGKGDAFKEVAAAVEAWPTTFEGDAFSVIQYRKHGQAVAAGILRDMAACIETGTSVKNRMVDAPDGLQ